MACARDRLIKDTGIDAVDARIGTIDPAAPRAHGLLAAIASAA